MLRKLFALAALALSLPAAAFADTEGASYSPGNAAPRSSQVGCIYRSMAVSAADGQQMALGCDANGNLVISGSGTSGARANAASPTLVEGTINPLSSDLHGGERVLNMDTSGVALDFTTPAQVILTGLLPFSSTPITCSSGNVANASAVCTLPAVTAKTTYITGFSCTGGGATVGAIVNMTITGLVSGTQTYTFAAPTGVALMTSLARSFSYPVVASAPNTTIVVTLPALGTGSTNAACNAEGFQL